MRRALSLLAAAFAAVSVPAAETVVIDAVADRVTCVYAKGETAVLTVTATGTNGVKLASGVLRVEVDNFGEQKIEARKVDLAKENPFTVRFTRETPGFVRLWVKPADASQQLTGRLTGGKGPYVYGIAFAPSEIRPGADDPEDFDAFWADAIRNLDQTVPVDAKMELVPGKSGGKCNYYRVSFASYGGRRVYGWLSEPKDLSKGPFPVRLSVPGAGIGAGGTGVCDDEIRLTMNVHSYPQPEGDGENVQDARKKAYDAQDAAFAAPNGVSRYCQAGIHKSREDYFYYASILGINRAVNWLAARPECDLCDFTYSGTSQGGGFGLILTALNRHITRSCIFVPAITDLLGNRVEGRQSGWPRIIEAQKPANRAAAEKWAPYFCGVNFARRITCPVRFVVGFADCTCPPHCVYAAYNACPAKDKVIFDGIGMGHGVFGDFYSYLGAWERERRAGTSDFRFLAFNIWGDFFGNPPAERAARQSALIRRWNPDLVGMQEVTRNFWASELFPALREEYGVIGEKLGPGGIDAADPILYRKSRFDLLECAGEWFCPELDTSKGMVWAALRDRRTGRNVIVFASHFWWRYDGIGDDWIRLYSARRLRAKLFELSVKHDAAVIGGGDLNAPMDSSGMKYLVSHGLADAQGTAKVSPRGYPSEHGDPVRDAQGAYFGRPAVRGINRVRPKSMYLDHIFYDPKRITVNRFDLDVSPEACSLSDHHPVCADFSLVK